MKLSLENIKKNLKKENIIPLYRKFAIDTLNPVTAFLRITQDNNKAFFLESITGGENIGRYCFIGVSPFQVIKVKDNTVIFEGHKNETIEAKNPFQEIQAFLARYKAMEFPGLPPFCGGAVGYIGFDSYHHFEDLNYEKPQNKISTLEKVEDAFLMIFENIIVFDRLLNRIIVISNINLDMETLNKGFKRANKEIDKLIKKLNTPIKNENIFLNFDDEVKPVKSKPIWGKDNFIAAVKKIKSYIREGDIFQCVISEQFKTKIKSKPFDIYRSLRAVSPVPYLFYLAMEDTVLLGASPETLVKVQAGEVETCPIAGTRPRGKTHKQDKKLEKDLLASVKEKAEHLMLVDLGRNDVGRVSEAGSVYVDEFMSVHRFSNVMHLVSLVKGKLKKGKNSFDAFQSCFPAGTLSGSPKIRAIEIIEELEPFYRGPYGGSVIYYDFNGSIDSCITIRSLHIHKGYGVFQAGAGIVADSNPEKEYEEVLHKSSAIAKAVSIANQMEEI